MLQSLSIEKLILGGKKVKKLQLLGLLLLSTILLFGCGGSKPAEAPKADAPKAEAPKTEAPKAEAPKADAPQDGGVLRVALSANIASLDPSKYTSVYESNVMRSIFTPLVMYNSDMTKFVPGVAKEWKVSEDFLTYTFKLREDVHFQKGKFQDGRKVTAEDVKYSLLRSLNDSKLNRLRYVKDVTTNGDYEVTVVLDRPYAPFLTMLSDMGNAIVPKEEVEGWKDDFGRNPVGTGPFAFEEWKSDSFIKLKRSENYFGQKPHLDGVQFSFITDINQMGNALLAGDIDFATVVKGPNVEAIKKNDKLVLTEIPGMSIGYMSFNYNEGPTAKLEVRQAMNYALNRDEIIAGVYKYGEAVPQYLPLPRASWGYSDKAEAVIKGSTGGNIEKAKELLKKAGYPDGFDLELYCAASRVPQATIVQAQMAKIGVKISIKTLEWGAFSETVSKGNAQSYIMGWNWDADPDFYLYQMLSSKQFGTLGNGGKYKNEQVDKLLDEATSKYTKQEDRKKNYEEALVLIAGDLPHLDLYNEKAIHGLSKKVQGFVPAPNVSLNFVTDEVNVWLKK